MSSIGTTTFRRRVERRVAHLLGRHGYHITFLSHADRLFLRRKADPTTPLPPEAVSYLDDSNPRLNELRNAYAQVNLPVTTHTRWSADEISRWVDLQYFRGETMFVWHYRETPQLTALKYFVFAEYVRARDPRSLLHELGEDGAFGCWTFDFPERGRYSRDLLDSVNELYFLDRHLGIFENTRLRVLDIGAGYGRLAHRMAQAVPGLADYCCVDAIPESSFVCEYYLKHRGVAPRGRVVTLDRIEHGLEPRQFDLAINVHSFSECSYDAVRWWIEMLVRLRVPRLFIVPNDGDRMLSSELVGTRRDFAPLLLAAGYRLIANEAAVVDPAVRQLLGVEDRFLLFELDN